ncbi:hypothetical protein [Halorubrum aquaticum]|uniref:hypothetical protein n=1 Tax=Halorubrum aquaticum TaxID=387340 RepID=UPI0031DA94C0
MPIDPERYTSGHHLIPQLEQHNPWWQYDEEFDPAGGVDAQRQAYADGVEALTDGEDFLIIGGVPSTETERLVEQLIGTVLQQGFQEQYIKDAELRAEASELIVPPENVLYLSLRTSPLYQVQSTSGLRGVIDHFQTHVAAQDHRQYLFFEGFDELRRPSRRGGDAGDSWLDALATVRSETENLTVVISVPSSTFVDDQLTDHPRFDTSADKWSLQSVDHLGFEEYLRLRYRRLDVAPLKERFDPQSARRSFRTAVRDGSVAPFVDHVHRTEGERVLDPSTLRRELTIYAITGGRLTAALDRADIDLGDTQFEQLLRNRGERPLQEFQSNIVEKLRSEVTSTADRLYGLKDSPGPIRLAAVVADDRPTEPVEFDDICTVLDVDRRTLREQYLRVLGDLRLAGGVSAYANKRPRSIGLYHRDPSVLAAFGGFDLRDALRQEPGLAPELWHAMAYDHTVRLSQRVNNPRDPKRGVVKHWSSDDRVIDFVLKIDGRPVPVVFSPDHTLADLKRESGPAAYGTLVSFLRRTDTLEDEDSLTTRHYAEVPDPVVDQRAAVVDEEGYFGTRCGDVALDGSAPFGIVVTNAREATDDGVTVDRSGPLPIVQVPLWTYLRLS